MILSLISVSNYNLTFISTIREFDLTIQFKLWTRTQYTLNLDEGIIDILDDDDDNDGIPDSRDPDKRQVM